MKTCNIEFEIEEIDYKINLTLLINKKKCRDILKNQKQEIKLNDIDFSFVGKCKKQTLDKGLNASKKVVHKADEFIGNKITDAVTKSNDDNINKKEPVEKIVIPLEKKRGIIRQIEKSIVKMKHYKISNFFKQFKCKKKWVIVNGLSTRSIFC